MTFFSSLEYGLPPSRTYGNAPVISISGDRGEGEGESVVINLRMETISPPMQGVDREQDMVVGGGIEITSARDDGERTTDEEEQW